MTRILKFEEPGTQPVLVPADRIVAVIGVDAKHSKLFLEHDVVATVPKTVAEVEDMLKSRPK